MNKADFFVYYDGPALAENRMDVRDLAPALLALGDLVQEANRVLNKDKAEIRVNVKTFQDGSFGVDLELVQTIVQHITSIFGREDVTAVREMVEVLFGGGSVYGLFALIKKIRNRKISSVKTLEKGNVVIVLDDAETIETNSKVVSVYRDVSVRTAVKKTVEPLRKEGISAFRVNKVEAFEGTEIEKEDTDFFDLPEVEDQLITETETVQSFSILSLSFKEDNKWRLSDGTNAFYVTITDKRFLGKVDNNEITFSKGDLLRVRLKTTQLETGEGLKTNYEAVEVVEHRSAARQLPLPFDDLSA